MATQSATFQPDSDVHITFEDQQKINRFAQLNAKVEDLRDDLKALVNDMKNLEDASDDLALADEGSLVPYLHGEIFISQTLEETAVSLEEAKEKKQKEIKELEDKCDQIKATMSDLKAHLYGRFGSHINLENDEE